MRRCPAASGRVDGDTAPIIYQLEGY